MQSFELERLKLINEKIESEIKKSEQIKDTIVKIVGLEMVIKEIQGSISKLIQDVENYNPWED
jgi:hypothetical protein